MDNRGPAAAAPSGGTAERVLCTVMPHLWPNLDQQGRQHLHNASHALRGAVMGATRSLKLVGDAAALSVLPKLVQRGCQPLELNLCSLSLWTDPRRRRVQGAKEACGEQQGEW